MRNLTGIRVSLLRVFLFLGGVLLAPHAGAATFCTGLPPSSLRVYDIRAEIVHEVKVPAAELGHEIQITAGIYSHHTLMLSGSDLAAWFNIEHRIVPRDDGLVCDAPVLVSMGFGSCICSTRLNDRLAV
jgi:hypothetical protein